MKFKYLIVACSLLLLFSACNNVKIYKVDDEVSKEIKLNQEFDKISNVSSADIEFVQSQDGKFKVELRAPKNMPDYLTINVIDGKLNIATDDNNKAMTFDNATIIIMAPSVKRIDMLGSGDLNIQHLDEESLTIETKGSGDLSINYLNVDNLSLSTFGSGDINVNEANSKVIKISTLGSGDISLSRINAEEVSATSLGSGDINLRGTTNQFISDSRGIGEINYNGLEIKNK